MSGALLLSRTPNTPLEAIIAAYNDVTERLKQSHDRLVEEVRRLRDQVEEKNRELARRERLAALGEMAAGVAHEIRNPLSGINLYASVLCQDLQDRPDCRQLARKIVAGVRTLDNIVGDILAFARPSVVPRAPVSVGQLVQAAVELAEPERQTRQSTIHVAPQGTGARVDAEAHQLQRAILNVLLNGLEAAGPYGNVWVSTVDLEDRAAIALDIADDGPGIDPAVRERIFNPFFTTKETGTGLGLAIVHSILEAHGGRVEVQDRPGGGVLFRLVLPRANTSTDA